jgi:tellurite resistance protein
MAVRLAAVVSWVGTLGGAPASGEGEALARSVLGDDRLEELRAFFANEPPEVALRERCAAVAACAWMARADLKVSDEEDAALSSVIAESGLPFESQLAMLAAVAQPWPLEKIAAELTQPGLRELMIALAWSIAKIDDEVDPAEKRAHEDLATAFGIGEARAKELRARA